MPKPRSPRGLGERPCDRSCGESQREEEKSQFRRGVQGSGERGRAVVRPSIAVRSTVVLIAAVVTRDGGIRQRRYVGVVVVRMATRLAVVLTRRIRHRHHRRMPGKGMCRQKHERNEENAQHEQRKCEPLPHDVLACRSLVHGHHTRDAVERAAKWYVISHTMDSGMEIPVGKSVHCEIEFGVWGGAPRRFPGSAGGRVVLLPPAHRRGQLGGSNCFMVSISACWASMICWAICSASGYCPASSSVRAISIAPS